MHLHLLSMDESYVDCIKKGPHVPMKAATSVEEIAQAVDGSIPKPASEWTLEDTAEVHKDKKAMNTLFNGLEHDMFDTVINYSSSKEVWDTIQTLCEGTEQKLLNGLKLDGRVYQTKYSNLKFLRSLPKEWKPMTVSLRNTQEYKSFTLERLYGTLKTYELEMEQDEEIEKSQKKGGSVALVASTEEHEDVKKETVKATQSSSACEGRIESNKGKGKMVDEDVNSNQDEMNEPSRKFSKLKFKKNPEAQRPFRKDFQPNKTFVERSKFKCFNYGMSGHFANECKKPKSEKKDRKFEHDYDWAADGNDSEEDTEYVNLELMANSTEQEASSSSNQVITTNLTELSKEECNSTINDMFTELYHLRVTLKSLTKENKRIKDANLFLSDRNVVLETHFIEFEKLKIDCQIAKNVLEAVLNREEILKNQLKKEHDVIARWNDSRNVATNIFKVQGMDTFCKESLNKDKKKLDVVIEDLGADDASTDSDHPLKDNSSTDESPMLKHTTSVSKEKLNKKYGPTNKNFVQGECSNSRKVEKFNIGHLSNKQLKDKLENIEVKAEVKKKKNRNGKVGINKHNNYTPDKYAPRKTRVNCGSVNHLSTNYKSVKNANVQMPMPVPNVHMPVMPNMFAHNAHASNLYANMSFVPNPYMNAFNIPQMPWKMPNLSTMYAQHSQMPASNIYTPKNLPMNMSQRSTPRVKVDLNQSKIKVQNDKRNKMKGNRRNLWYLDNGCSRHMTGDSTLLTEFKERAGPRITFGDDNKGYTKGYCLIAKENVIIDEVALVDGLKHNLLSISQLCDKGFFVSFTPKACVVSSKKDNNVVLTGYRKGNVYLADFNSTNANSITCLFSKSSKDESWPWHKRLSHLNFKSMNDLVKKGLVRGIPQLEFFKDGLCDACRKGKQKKAFFRSKTESSIDQPLQLLHMDLFGLVNVMSISKKKYCLVIVDDFSKFTWTYFLHSKDEASEIIINHIKVANNHPEYKVRRIRSDNGTEFKNSSIKLFCEENGIVHEFYAARTPQQNKVVKRKNRTLIEAARKMLDESRLPTYFWVEAVNTACFT
ncbi:hypothetical protein POM88_005856 [Heracleum sosnowskyi]|uniref:Integrase catalytic domain-containing protein n=1 Tax=Heracleum sosnowskyi TaxID=360622 RepID=A0AAD8J2R4_9APIA|nr:hypothetical protein POM88_005856 [Heracleum sosnowskyi]